MERKIKRTTDLDVNIRTWIAAVAHALLTVALSGPEPVGVLAMDVLSNLVTAKETLCAVCSDGNGQHTS